MRLWQAARSKREEARRPSPSAGAWRHRPGASTAGRGIRFCLFCAGQREYYLMVHPGLQCGPRLLPGARCRDAAAAAAAGAAWRRRLSSGQQGQARGLLQQPLQAGQHGMLRLQTDANATCVCAGGVKCRRCELALALHLTCPVTCHVPERCRRPLRLPSCCVGTEAPADPTHPPIGASLRAAALSEPVVLDRGFRSLLCPPTARARCPGVPRPLLIAPLHHCGTSSCALHAVCAPGPRFWAGPPGTGQPGRGPPVWRLQ